MENSTSPVVDGESYVRQILVEPDEVLSQRCREVRTLGPDIRRIATELVETAKKGKNGYGRALGLAAPQIGYQVRIFTSFGIVYVNPEIVAHSEEQRQMQESCFSIPLVKNRHGVEFMVKTWIPRYRWVRMKWQNIAGKTFEHRFSRMDAQIVQHEIDHLDGLMCNRFEAKKTG